MKKSECVGLQPMTETQFNNAVSDAMKFVPVLAQIAPKHYTIEHSVVGSGKNQKKVVTFYNPSYTRPDGSEGKFIAVGLVEEPDILVPISALAMRGIVAADGTNVLSRGFFDNTEDLAKCKEALESSKLEFDLEHLHNARWAEGRRKGTRPVVKVTQ